MMVAPDWNWRLRETVWIDEHLRQSRDSEFGNLQLKIFDVCLGSLKFVAAAIGSQDHDFALVEPLLFCKM